MASEILKSVKEDLLKLEPSILEAEELLDVMKEVGEDVVEMTKELRSLKTRKEKWERVLKARNI